MRTYEVARITTGGCSEQEIEKGFTESSDDIKESESEQETEMAKDSRKGKRSRTSGAANENPSEGQNDTDSSNSGGPAEAPIINDNRASTSSNSTMAKLQEASRNILRKLNAKNEETQMDTKMLTIAQLIAENERLKKENLTLLNKVAGLLNWLTEIADRVTRFEAEASI